MSVTIVLDTGPLGLATHPKGGEDARRCKQWLRECLGNGARVVVPAIADYELRRELVRAGKVASIRRLDALIGVLGYLPIDRLTMQGAAEFWADARRRGHPTAPDLALDGDCLLAALALQAIDLDGDNLDEPVSIVVATTNPGHLTRYVDARLWSEIRIEAP